MELQIDTQYILDTFRTLVNTPSPVGYYREINPVVAQIAKELGYEVTCDNRNTVYITVDGQDNSKTVMIGGHLDTLGFVVRRIDDDGMIRIRNLGGVSHTSMESETVTVHTRDGRKYTGLYTCQSHSVHVFDDARTLERNEQNMMILLDQPIKTRQDVLDLGIRHGDMVSFEPRCTVTDNGYLKSRFIDDKGAVACIFAMLKYLTEHNLKPKYRTLLAFPHYEEIGHGGSYLPPEVEEFVAIDIGLIGPDYEGNEFNVAICCKDAFPPYDYDLTSRIIETAGRIGCDYAVDIFYHYGTDASIALKSGNNVRVAAFGMPVYCSHAVERTHVKSLENTTKLLLGYALGL